MARGNAARVCFGAFEVDPQKRKLRRHGIPIRMQDQPFRILLILLERPGEVVTRDELRERLWPAGTFVEFEHSLNTSINKLRRALSDSAEKPRYVETVPRHGYRFIGALQPDAPAGEPRAAEPGRQRRIWAGIGLAAALTGGTLVWRGTRAVSEPAFHVTPLTSYQGLAGRASFSPDGTQVAFLWNGPDQDNIDIYVKVVGSSDALRLTAAPEIDDAPAWSPDGRWIAFVRREREAPRGGVYVVSPLGGSERRIGETVFGDMKQGPTLDWTPDSRWVAIHDDSGLSRPRGLYLLSPKSGEMKLAVASERTGSDWGAAFSKEGKKLVFSRGGAIHVVDVEGFTAKGEPRRLTQPGEGFERWPTWSADQNEILFARWMGLGQATLWRIRADGAGKAEQIPNIGSTIAVEPAIPRAGGRLAYSERTYNTNIWQFPLPAGREGTGPGIRLIGSSRFEGTMSLSPDGRRVAFTSTRSGSEEIWVAGSDGSRPTALTHYGGGMAGTARWSPDGRFIAYDAFQGGNRDIYIVGADGGTPVRLTDNPQDDRVPAWSADGKWIYFSSDKGGRRVIWRKPASGGEEVQVTKDGGLGAKESPDGRIFCYFTQDPERLWAMPVKGGVPDEGGKRLVSESASSFVYDVANSGVYFAGMMLGHPTFFPRFGPVYRYDFASGRTRMVADVPSLSLGLAVSRDERTLLLSKVEAAHSDLMLVEPFR